MNIVSKKNRMKLLLLIYFSSISFNSIFCELLKSWGQPSDSLSAKVNDKFKMRSPLINPTTEYEYPGVI